MRSQRLNNEYALKYIKKMFSASVAQLLLRLFRISLDFTRQLFMAHAWALDLSDMSVKHAKRYLCPLIKQISCS